jgi:hypothetical protein
VDGHVFPPGISCFQYTKSIFSAVSRQALPTGMRPTGQAVKAVFSL